MNIIKEELQFEENLKQRLVFVCEFANATPTFINGSIRKIDRTNISYIEPHKVIVKNIAFLVFNYSNDVYISNLTKKIKLSELEEYIKSLQISKIQENENDKTYAVFVTNILQEEVLSDFRSRKNYQFRGKDSVKTGLKIIALSIQDIIKLINVKIQYSELYEMFESAYKDTETNDLEWYEKLIKNKVNIL